MEEKHICVAAVEWGYQESDFCGQFLTKEELIKEKKLTHYNEDNICEFNYCPFCGKKIEEV